MKDEFLVTLLTSSGEKQCLQRFKNVVACFNKVLRDYDTVIKTQCWNLKGPSAKNNVDDVRDSLDNSDLVICVVDPTASETVRDDVVQALDWVRESFMMSFFAVKERNMFIYVKETSGNGDRQKAQRAVSFLETLYKKDYKPITYPSENAFALTLLYQLCNMVRSELFCQLFPLEKGCSLGEVFTPEGIGQFGISFQDLPWVKNFNGYSDLKSEIDALKKALPNSPHRHEVAYNIYQKQKFQRVIEGDMLKAYYILCRFFCRQNTPEMTEVVKYFLSGNLAQANKKLNTAQLVRRISAFRKNPTASKSAGGTKMEFDYLLNCYLLKIYLIKSVEQGKPCSTIEQLYNQILSVSQGLVTFVEQMDINNEAAEYFMNRSKIPQALTQLESSVKMYESFSKEKQKKTVLLGIESYHLTAKCLEKELGDIKFEEGENLPRKTISALKTIRTNYQNALREIKKVLGRYPKNYWPIFATVYRDFYNFFIQTAQFDRAERLSQETRQMLFKLGSQNQNPTDTNSTDTNSTDNTPTDTTEETKSNPVDSRATESHKGHKDNGGFILLLDKIECMVDLDHKLPERAQKRIPKGITSYVRSSSKNSDKVEDDLFSWMDSEEKIPNIIKILQWNNRPQREESLDATLKEESDNLNNEEQILSQEIVNPCGVTAQCDLNSEDKACKEENEESGCDEVGTWRCWDIAEILLDQAKIYHQEQDFVKSIRFTAAALESINRRLLKNVSLSTLILPALHMLQSGCYRTGNYAYGFECGLQIFLLLQQSLQEGKDSALAYSLIKPVVYEIPMTLDMLLRDTDKSDKISQNLLVMVRDYIIENYMLTDTMEVSMHLQEFLKYYKKIGFALQAEKTRDQIRKVDLILKSQRQSQLKNYGGFGNLFGLDI